MRAFFLNKDVSGVWGFLDVEVTVHFEEDFHDMACLLQKTNPENQADDAEQKEYDLHALLKRQVLDDCQVPDFAP